MYEYLEKKLVGSENKNIRTHNEIDYLLNKFFEYVLLWPTTYFPEVYFLLGKADTFHHSK